VSAPSPGWHPNPDGTGTQRWWDGARWTDQVRPAGTPAPQVSQPWLPQPRSSFDPERVVIQQGARRSAEPGPVAAPPQRGPYAVQPYGTTALPTTVGPEAGAMSYGPAPDASTGLPLPTVGYGGVAQLPVAAGPTPFPTAARPYSPGKAEIAAGVVAGQAVSRASTPAGGVLAGASMLLFGIIFSAVSLMIVPELVAAHARADETTTHGTVVALHESTGRKGSRLCSPEASFVVDGTAYRAQSGVASSTCPSLDGSVAVIYTTADPGEARVRAAASSLMMAAVFPAVGFCLMLGGLVGVVRGGLSVLSARRSARG
jgi:hypothetical protein